MIRRSLVRPRATSLRSGMASSEHRAGVISDPGVFVAVEAIEDCGGGSNAQAIDCKLCLWLKRDIAERAWLQSEHRRHCSRRCRDHNSPPTRRPRHEGERHHCLDAELASGADRSSPPARATDVRESVAVASTRTAPPRPTAHHPTVPHGGLPFASPSRRHFLL